MKRETAMTPKRQHSSVLLTGIIAGIFFLVLPGCSMAAKKSSDEKAEKKIVAKVNGQPIYEDALAPLVKKEMRKFKKYGGKRDTSKLEKHLQKKALDQVIAQELLYQESRKMKIEGIEEKIAERMKKTREKYESSEKFASYLKTKGLTEKDVENSIRRSIHIDEYLKVKGIRDPEVPEEEIKAYYDNNKNSFKRDEAINALNILIMTKEDAGPEERAEARAKAEKIRKEILAGEDFAEIAKKHSEDARAPQGGDLGFIKRGYMPKEFDEVAFALKKDEVSDVVQTKHGYHVIKVVDTVPEGITPYEEVRDFIGKFLQGQLEEKNYYSQVKELKSKAKIEILLNESEPQ